MTTVTEDDFHAALDARPDDHITRLVFADWLDERDDPRAAGYRALGARRRRPCHVPSRERFAGGGWHWGGQSAQRPYANLGEAWFIQLMADVYEGAQIDFGSRRAAEDAAALAFARLPAERRAELLRGAALPV